MKKGVVICYILSFSPHIAGSAYHHSSSVSFDVTKSTPRDTETSSKAAADVISVAVPRELRGRSEVLVFISPQPVQGMCSPSGNFNKS